MITICITIIARSSLQSSCLRETLDTMHLLRFILRDDIQCIALIIVSARIRLSPIANAGGRMTRFFWSSG